MKILDVGCGTGVMMQELKSYGKVWGLDINNKALKYCQDKKAGDFLLKTNLEQKLPLKKNFFDLIVCLDVLEHINKELFTLLEIKRILKKNGSLIIIVPSYKWFFSYWDKIAGHYRRYDMRHLRKILEQVGLKTKKISYFNLFVLLPAIIFRSIKSRQKLSIEDIPSDFIVFPEWLNCFLLLLSSIERIIIGFINLPAGLSLFILARKEDD